MKEILSIIILVLIAAQTFAQVSKHFVDEVTFVEAARSYLQIPAILHPNQTGCFNDANAASSDRNVHRSWAEKQNSDGLKSEIKTKLEQLFLCLDLRDDDLFKDFATLSIVISDSGTKDSCYGGDLGVLNKNWSVHYDWARGKSRGTLLTSVLSKSLATIDCLDREKQVSYYTEFSLKLAAMSAVATSVAQKPVDKARGHFVRALTIVEMAKSPVDFEAALKEFELAAGIDRSLAAAYFNAGAIQENLGRYEQAISNFKRYLQILPNAKDAQAVKDLITKTEQKIEQKKKAVENYKKITGVWLSSYDGAWFDEYALYLENNELKMKLWFSTPKDSSVSFDGQTLRAKWRANAAGVFYEDPARFDLDIRLNENGPSVGNLRQTTASGVRDYQVVMTRDLLRSTYPWQASFKGEMDWRRLYGGKFILENTNKGHNRTFPKLGMHDYERDFSLEAKMTFISGDEGNFYGLMWGNVRNEFYFFGVMASGNYAFRKSVNGNWTEILNARPSTAIRKGNAANTLTVKQKGEKMEFYINGTMVDTAPSDKYFGFIGFHLNHYMKVEVDYLRMDYQ